MERVHPAKEHVGQHLEGRKRLLLEVEYHWYLVSQITLDLHRVTSGEVKAG